MWRNM